MDKNKDTETDKIEQRRAETKARLDALKAKDGTKKPIKTGSRFGRILFPIIVVLLVLVVAVFSLTTLTLDKQNISKRIHYS